MYGRLVVIAEIVITEIAALIVTLDANGLIVVNVLAWLTHCFFLVCGWRPDYH